MPNEKNPEDGAPRPDGDEPAATPRPEDTLPAEGPEPPAPPGPDAGVEELAALVDALADPGAASADLPAPEDTLADLPASLPEEKPVPDAGEDERGTRFRATEAEVRGLRQRKRDGLITQEQLLQELRRHMIEDDGVWWMLGVETDTWYRYDELAGGWVIASPPAHAGVSAGGAIDVHEGLAGPEETLSGTLPPGFALDEDELPRTDTPLYDEEATIPGMAAIHQGTQRLSQEEAPRSAAPTVAGPAQQLRERLAPRAGVPPPRPAASPTSARNLLPQRLLLLAALLGGAFLALLALTGLVVLLRYNSIVGTYSEAIDALAQAQPAFQSLRILDGNGELLAELDSEDGRREPRALGDISPWLIAAVLAAQEPLFYGSSDFNLPRIAGDLFGSAPDESLTIARRLAELSIRNEGVGAAAQARHRNIVAAELARRYDRNTLLERYLNEAEFGPRVFGAQAAAQFWFGLDANQLQPVESALLASFLTHPGVTPLEAATRAEAFANTDALLRTLAGLHCLNLQHASAHPDFATPFCAHRQQILDDQGDFSPAINLQRATLGTRDFSAPTSEAAWPHFSAQVVAGLRASYGEDAFRSGATVHTTLDPRIQQAAADALRDQLQSSGRNRNVQTGAVSVVDPASGELLALVGEGDPQAIPGFQAPDAALMPLLYAAALEGVGDRNGNGQLDHDEYLTAASILWDVPGQAPNPFFPPLPHGNLTRGPVSLRSALANALNIPAARVWDFVTRERFLETAARLGLKTFQTAGGDGLGDTPGETGVLLPELMQAYSTLANYGRYQPLSAIRAVTLADGSELPRRDAPDGGDVLHPGVALLIGNLMAEDSGRSIIGEDSPLTLPSHEGAIAAIANTTLGSRDLWTMGYSNNLVVGVWLGRHDDQPTASSGLLEAAPVFRRVMQAALQGRPAPTRFSGVQATLAMAPVCRLSGALPDAGCPGGQGDEFFVPGYPPPPPEQGAIVSRTIDTWSGLLANEFCPQFHREQTFLRLESEDPLVTAWLGSAAGQTFLSANGLTDLPVGAAPTAACDVSTRQPTLELSNPPHNSVVQGSITVTGTVAAQNMERFELTLVTIRGALIQQLGSWEQQRPGQGEALVQWNTAAVPNGQYLLRLTARSVGGGYAQREAFVVISNAAAAGG